MEDSGIAEFEQLYYNVKQANDKTWGSDTMEREDLQGKLFCAIMELTEKECDDVLAQKGVKWNVGRREEAQGD